LKLLCSLPRFREAYRLLPELRARENWPRDRIEAYQLDRLNGVWQHAINHVPYYRELCAREDLPPIFSSLDEYQAAVPVLPREVVRERSQDILSENAGPGEWDRTGGTTGAPLKAFWGRDAVLQTLRAKYRFHAAWDIDIFARTVFLWGHASSFQPGFPGWLARRKQPMMDRLRNRLRLSAYRLGGAELREHLRRIARFRPAVLYGYSRAVQLLAEEAQEMRFRCDSLRAVILTSEPAPPHVTAAIEEAFGVPAIIEYGSVECGLLAAEWPDRTLRVPEDMVLLETAPRPDSQFEILVTRLTNPDFPLLRYAIGDFTDAPLSHPPQGFACLGQVLGRLGDLARTRSGRPLHSMLIDHIVRYEFTFIRRYQARQLADGSVRLLVEIRPDVPSPNLAAVEKRISHIFEGYPVRVEVVDAVPLTGAGKHRLVISELDAKPDAAVASLR
jgi:phenylacetate-CoA ligase